MSRLETPVASPPATRALRAMSSESAWHNPDDMHPPYENEHVLADGLPTVCKADIARDDLTGLRLGHYALGKKIGAGGMGKVFHARHLHLNRDLAIKFMGTDVSSSAEAQLRFAQETLALGKLQHPLIVNAIDAGCVSGLRYLVTELIDGEDLFVRVQQQGPLEYRDACELIRQAAIGLAHSHKAGFVHRDIKPSNLIVDSSGTIKILDFGLVRNVHLDQQLTANGDMLGTWDFLAPEQAHDASDVDHRSDLYSLGCTLVYLLSGRVPYDGVRYATPAAKLKGHLLDVPAWLQTPPRNVPLALIKVIRRMVEKSPENRFQNASDVATTLAPFTAEREDVVDVFDAHPPDETSIRARGAWRIALMGLGILAFLTVGLADFVWHAAQDIRQRKAAGGAIYSEPTVSTPTHEHPISPMAPQETVADPVSRGPVQPTLVEEQAAADPIQIHSFSTNPDLQLPKSSRRITVDPTQTSNASPLIVPFGSRARESIRREWKPN